MSISAVQSAVCVQRSPAIDWKNAMKQDGDERGSFFHTWGGWMCYFPAECLRGGLGRPRGRSSAPRLGLFDRRRRGSQQVGVCVCEWRRTRSNLPSTQRPRVDGAALTPARWESLRRCGALSGTERHCAALCSASLERLRLSSVCFNPINALFSRAPCGEVGDSFTV